MCNAEKLYLFIHYNILYLFVLVRIDNFHIFISIYQKNLKNYIMVSVLMPKIIVEGSVEKVNM